MNKLKNVKYSSKFSHDVSLSPRALHLSILQVSFLYHLDPRRFATAFLTARFRTTHAIVALTARAPITPIAMPAFAPPDSPAPPEALLLSSEADDEDESPVCDGPYGQ